MASWTVSPAHVTSRYSISEEHVLPVSNGSDMEWVYTAPNSADVVNLFAFRNWPESKLVDETMRVNILAFGSFAKEEEAVSSAPLPTEPVPMTCSSVDMYFAEESLNNFGGYAHGSYHTIAGMAGQP